MSEVRALSAFIFDSCFARHHLRFAVMLIFFISLGNFYSAICLVLITGCQSNETSADVRPADGKAYGALTHTIDTVYRQNPQTDYRDLVYGVRAAMLEDNVAQNPTLECSARNASLPFIC
jgi:hypothetical protein